MPSSAPAQPPWAPERCRSVRLLDEFGDGWNGARLGFGDGITPAGVALEAAMLSVGLRVGDEVICPALAPARLVAAIVRAGGIPCFVDVDSRTGGMRPDAVDAAVREGRGHVVT